MFRRFAKEDVEKFKKKMTVSDNNEVIGKDMHELTERTQRIVEGSHFSMREYNLKLDDIINDQRKIVYDLRNRVLDGKENFSILKTMIADAVEFIIEDTLPEDLDIQSQHIESIEKSLSRFLKTEVSIPAQTTKRKRIDDAVQPAIDDLLERIESFSTHTRINRTIPAVMKTFIDQMWVKHLESMTHLKEGIGLRSYQQEDPMRIYAREGLELFGGNFQRMRYSIASELIGFIDLLEKEAKEEQK